MGRMFSTVIVASLVSTLLVGAASSVSAGESAHEVERQTLRPDAAGRTSYVEWEKPPADPNGTCMIILSEDGDGNCGDRFISIGCRCVKLVYDVSCADGGWKDGQRAVRIVRSQAAKRGFDPNRIGVVAMSGGARLAALLATSSQTSAYEPVDEIDRSVPCNVNWAIIGAFDRLPDAAPAFRFDGKTAPMCMIHDGADYRASLSLTQTYRQLKRKKIPSELHLCASSPEGAWFDRAREFMTQMEFLGPLAAPGKILLRYPDDSARGAYEKENIWPTGKMPEVQTNQCTPYIEWHMPKTLKTKAIQIIYSGGAYNKNSPNGNEVAPFRRYLNAKGMAVVTMKYRTPRPAPPLEPHATAWQDLQRAIRIVKSKAESKGLDPSRIGVMGSSAGGHLSLLGAASSQTPAYAPIDELDAIPCNVQWALVIYPGYVFAGRKMRPEAPDGGELPLSPDLKFDSDTPPMILMQGDSDVWSSVGCVKVWERLGQMGVPCDLHTLALRPHCFQNKASPGTGSYTYLDRLWEFMDHIGANK